MSKLLHKPESSHKESNNVLVYVLGNVNGPLNVAGNDIFVGDNVIGSPSIPETNSSSDESKMVNHLRNSALAFFESGQWRELDDTLKEFVKLVPGAVFVYELTGFVRIQLRDFDGALNEYTTALHTSPRSWKSYAGRGFAYLQLNRQAAAIADLSAAIELSPKSKHSSLHLLRGIPYVFRQAWDEGLVDFSEAIRLGSKRPYAYYLRGLCLSQIHNKTDETLADLSKAISLNPSLTYAFVTRSVVLAREGKLEEALRDAELAYERIIDNPVMKNNLAYILFRLERFEEAEQLWQKAVSLLGRVENSHAFIFAGLSLALLKRGNIRSAVAKYRKAIKLDSQWRTNIKAIAGRYIWTEEMIETAESLVSDIENKTGR